MKPRLHKKAKIALLDDQQTTRVTPRAADHCETLQVPEDLRESPVLGASARGEAPSPLQIPKPAVSARTSVPAGPASKSHEERSMLLSSNASVNADEEFGDDEKMLNEFVKMHPMLS